MEHIAGQGLIWLGHHLKPTELANKKMILARLEGSIISGCLRAAHEIMIRHHSHAFRLRSFDLPHDTPALAQDPAEFHLMQFLTSPQPWKFHKNPNLGAAEQPDRLGRR